MLLNKLVHMYTKHYIFGMTEQFSTNSSILEFGQITFGIMKQPVCCPGRGYDVMVSYHIYFVLLRSSNSDFAWNAVQIIYLALSPKGSSGHSLTICRETWTGDVEANVT